MEGQQNQQQNLNQQHQQLQQQQYEISPNNENMNNQSRKSDGRLLTDNKFSYIIADLIEKTKILAEELKNSNKIASELMLQNSDLRKKYSNLKDKFLQFLNDEEIIDYMENDQTNTDRNNIIKKLKEQELTMQNLKNDNINLDSLNQTLQEQIKDLSIRCNNLEKQTKANSLLNNIQSNKDLEINNLKLQITAMQEQINNYQNQLDHYIDQENQNNNNINNNNINNNINNQSQLQQQFYETQQINNQREQPKEKMSRAYSQIQLSSQNLNQINNNDNYHQNNNNNNNFGMANQKSVRELQNRNQSSSNNSIVDQNKQRAPLSQKNSYFNKNFNFDYNDLLYSQPNETEELQRQSQQSSQQYQPHLNSFQQQRDNHKFNQTQQYPPQQQQQYLQQQQQQQQQYGQRNNNQYQQNNMYSEDQENSGHYENNNHINNNNQMNVSESNRLILQAGAGKSLIDPQNHFGRHKKYPSAIDPSQAAKFSRSSVLKNKPNQNKPTVNPNSTLKKK